MKEDLSVPVHVSSRLLDKDICYFTLSHRGYIDFRYPPQNLNRRRRCARARPNKKRTRNERHSYA